MDATDIGGIIIGLALVLIGVFMLLNRITLKKRCTAQVDGTLLDIHISERDEDSNSSATITAKYKYLANGVEYEKKRMLSKGQYRALGKVDGFTVFYDPSKPKRHYVSEIKFRMLLTIVLIVIGALLLWVFL